MRIKTILDLFENSLRPFLLKHKLYFHDFQELLKVPISLSYSYFMGLEEIE